MGSTGQSDPRKVTLEILGTASIDDYESDITFIWGDLDRDRSLLEIWGRVVEHASRLAEGLRRQLYDRVQLELAGVVFWVMTFTGQARRVSERTGKDRLIRVQTPLSDLMWFKYPGICPVCRQSKCRCLVNLKDVEARHEGMNDEEIEEEKKQNRDWVRQFAKDNEVKTVRSLGSLENMFKEIYYSNILASPVDSIGFHLFEEIGEVTMAITRMYTYDKEEPDSDEYQKRILDLEDEIADVVSWLFSLSVKLHLIFKNFDNYVKHRYQNVPLSVAEEITLASAIRHKYCDTRVGGKLHCKKYCTTQPKCTCKIIILADDKRLFALSEG